MKLICIGKNYLKHINELNSKTSKYNLILFKKFSMLFRFKSIKASNITMMIVIK